MTTDPDHYQEMQIEGHKLAALSFNPDAPGLPIVLLHGIIASVYFWSPDLLAPFVLVRTDAPGELRRSADGARLATLSGTIHHYSDPSP